MTASQHDRQDSQRFIALRGSSIYLKCLIPARKDAKNHRNVISSRLLFPWQWHCPSRILTLVQAPVQNVANWRLNLENPWRSCTTTSEVQESEFVLTPILMSANSEQTNTLWFSPWLCVDLLGLRVQLFPLLGPWSREVWKAMRFSRFHPFSEQSRQTNLGQVSS